MASRKKLMRKCDQYIVEELLEDWENLWMGNIMDMCPTAEEQVPYILYTIEAKDSFYNDASILYDWINEAFTKYIGNLEDLQILGSAMSRSALKDSTVDVFVGFGDLVSSPDDAYIKVRNAINKYKGFKDLFVLTGDDEPVIQCTQPNGFIFNIYFTKRHVIYRSRLIHFVMSFDNSRIKEVASIVTFWLKKQKLYGKIPGHVFKILIVFFFQCERILPSVIDLQKTCRSQEMITNWDVSLPSQFMHQHNNLSTNLELIQRFFEFYGNFDFNSKIICPFVGKILPKNTFENSNSLPSEYESLRINFAEAKFHSNSAVCIQDPFFHNQNLAKNISKEIADDFQKFCCVAAKIFQTEKQKCLDDNKYQKTLLFCELFKPIQPFSGHQLIKILKAGKYEKTVFQNNFKKKPYLSFEIFLLTQFSNYIDNENLDIIDVNKLFSFFKDFLKYIVKCDYETVSTSDTTQGSNRLEIFKCKLRSNEIYCVKYRQSVKDECEKDGNCSLKLIEEKVKNACWGNPKCECNTKRSFTPQFEAFFIIKKKDHLICHFTCLDNGKESCEHTFNCIEPLLFDSIYWRNN